MQNSKIDSKMIIDSKLRKINFFETTIIVKQICDILYSGQSHYSFAVY